MALTEAQKSVIETARARLTGKPSTEKIGEEELPVIARVPGGGRVLEMPDGTQVFRSPQYSTSNPEEVERILKEFQDKGPEMQPPVVSRAQREVMGKYGPVVGTAQKYLEGLPFVGSWADEAVGAVQGPRAEMAAKTLSSAMEKEYPATSATAKGMGLLSGAYLSGALGAETVGGIPALSKVGGQVRQMPTLGQAMTLAPIGAGIGATEGLMYGAGEGEPGKRVESAISGAGFGGVGGAIGGFGSPYLARLLEFRRATKQSIAPEIANTLGVSSGAARIIEQTLDEGLDLNEAIARIRRAGDQGMIADANEATAALLDAAASSSATGAAVARGPVEARAEQASQRLGQSMTETLGAAPQATRTSMQEIAARSAPQREAAYKLAYEQPIDYASDAGIRIESIFDRIPDRLKREAIQEANEAMQEQGRKNLQIMADIADDGTITFREMPNIEQLHYVKQALDTIGYSVDELGRPTAKSLRAKRLGNELREAMRDAVPEYGVASRLGGEKIAEQQALILGRDLMNPRTSLDDVVSQMQGASKSERDAAKLGLRSQIEDVMSNTRTSASTGTPTEISEAMNILRQMSSRAFRQKAEVVLGESDARKLFGQLDETIAALELRGAVQTGSQTARRQAIQAGVEEATTPGFWGQIARGNVPAAAKELASTLTGATKQYTEQQKAKLWQDIAKALTERKGKDAEVALRYLLQAMEGKKLSQPKAAYLSDIATSIIGAGSVGAGRESKERLTGE